MSVCKLGAFTYFKPTWQPTKLSGVFSPQACAAKCKEDSTYVGMNVNGAGDCYCLRSTDLFVVNGTNNETTTTDLSSYVFDTVKPPAQAQNGYKIAFFILVPILIIAVVILGYKNNFQRV